MNSSNRSSRSSAARAGRLCRRADPGPPALPYFLQGADKVPAGVTYFWNLWPRHYDYVYILFTTPKTPNPAKKHLELVYDGAAFALYRVRRPEGSLESSALH